MSLTLKKILIIGQGGREHALAKALKQNNNYEIHIVPGNDGMTQDGICYPQLQADQHESILQLCVTNQFEFVFIGPEDPLVNGLSDFLRSHQILVVGPSQAAAKLEGSKIFAKEFMNRAHIPTARFAILNSFSDVEEQVKNFTAPYVFKYDGLAGGKGVVICQTPEEVLATGRKVFIDKIFSLASPKAILEEYISGYELSYILITNGTHYSSFPLAQDHKRLLDNNQGPNTGGMGTVAPLNISNDLENKIRSQVIVPSLQQLQKEKLLYYGIMFLGLMIYDNTPYLLEYNVRLGDPETQVILPLIKNDLVQVFTSLAKGHVEPLEFKNKFATCVIGAAAGYPNNPVKNTEILGDIFFNTQDSHVISAGVKNIENKWVTNGGRVLGYVGLGDSLENSQNKAYKLIEKINWHGMQYREDIGRYLTSPNS